MRRERVPPAFHSGLSVRRDPFELGICDLDAARVLNVGFRRRLVYGKESKPCLMTKRAFAER